MQVKSRVFPPFIAKRVEGIFGYDILLYGFLFRRQWGSFLQSFARIGLLFMKWRRVEHKAAGARTFSVWLARSIPRAAMSCLWKPWLWKTLLRKSHWNIYKNCSKNHCTHNQCTNLLYLVLKKHRIPEEKPFWCEANNAFIAYIVGLPAETVLRKVRLSTLRFAQFTLL